MNQGPSPRVQKAATSYPALQSQQGAAWFGKKLLFLIMFAGFSLQMLPAQTINNNGQPKREHSPHRASIYSAVLPGLGQAYNRKYWKIPVIYAGFGAVYYVTSENTREYRKFLEAYRFVVNQDTVPINNDYVGRYNEQQLLSGKNHYRRNLEIGYIVAGVLYILNIIDASVDAHLFYYDVGENLSMRLEPTVLNDPLAAKPVSGVSLTMRF